MEHHPHPALVNHDVVAAAEESESFDVRRPALGPREEMVSIEMLDLVTAREGARGVPQPQGTTLCAGGQAL